MTFDVGTASLAIAAVIGSGGIGALLNAWMSARRGIASDERETRRDTIADRDSLLGTVLAEVRELRERVEVAERTSRQRSDHIDVLEHHIWRGLGPPPPQRPQGV